jgi:hypothetical protein
MADLVEVTAKQFLVDPVLDSHHRSRMIASLGIQMRISYLRLDMHTLGR